MLAEHDRIVLTEDLRARVEREGRVAETFPDVQTGLDARADQLVVAGQDAAKREVAGAADE